METNINKTIRLDHYNSLGETLVGVDYFKSDNEVFIFNESNEYVSILPQNIPALISMLQSTMGEVGAIKVAN